MVVTESCIVCARAEKMFQQLFLRDRQTIRSVRAQHQIHSDHIECNLLECRVPLERVHLLDQATILEYVRTIAALLDHLIHEHVREARHV
jgi:hypothetical protein